ncbi:MAG TPA: hypothetical protein VF323_00465 [Candidatus Limnocylindrales bacterium]
MDRDPRWEGDERMTGVADGTPMLDALAAMRVAMSEPGWVTEDPEAHLNPKLAAWLVGDGAERWATVEVTTEERWLIVAAEWIRVGGRMGDLRADAFAPIGSFAEEVTHVAQQRRGDLVEFEIATGQLTAGFAPHGHLIRLRPTGVEVERAAAGLR